MEEKKSENNGNMDIKWIIRHKTDGIDSNAVREMTRKYYDERGFDQNGIHEATRTVYNIKGFDINGFHKATGTTYDENGFDENGLHNVTGTIYNEYGFDIKGHHIETESWKDPNGFDRDGLYFCGRGVTTKHNNFGFDVFGIHKDTGTPYDEYGFDIKRYHKDTGTTCDADGFCPGSAYNKGKFDLRGIHRDTGEIYDNYFINSEGFNIITKEDYKFKKITYCSIEEEVNRYLSEQTTLPDYCQKYGLDLEYIRRMFEILKSNPKYGELISNALDINQKKFFGTQLGKFKEFMTGKLDISILPAASLIDRVFSKKEKLLYKEQFVKIFLSDIEQKQDLQIYSAMLHFGIDPNSKRQAIEDVVTSISAFIRDCKNSGMLADVPNSNLGKLKKEIEKYRAPYISMVGMTIQFGDQEPITITQQHQNEAMNYVKQKGIYRCALTLNKYVKMSAMNQLPVLEDMEYAEPEEPKTK